MPKDEQDGFPTILPMLGCTGNFETRYLPNSQAAEPGTDGPGAFPEDDNRSPDEPDPSQGPRTIYIHGHVSARLLKLPTSDDPAPSPAPVCIAATHIDGLVLALTPFHHSCNYRSVVVHGLATLVIDQDEKDYAMHLITDNVLAMRWANSRTPPTKAELQSTSLLRIDIVNASAKIRIGGPSDDRHDLKDEEVTGGVWAGTVPMYLQYGEPIESSYNQVKTVPRYLEEWRRKENTEAKENAEQAVREVKKK
ncbi:flavin-nucleotide-binding protein [Eremomyces bilateralis CBS 781.70]|uniref:Flavin-nucleotide-binding protein n=1 Tax=Eremomyces bilateralis CBS 781.70 TaxID=1392243 RepID=A0A6G1FZQ1_9PEZI|nr:flavin-nucleotide-binding protein [Eremomyces bilateralis CBS 781.70]KAF1811273.1 flavin-nucleotide-binding protein [Eremomyces bilateralis CBS 781.70]